MIGVHHRQRQHVGLVHGIAAQRREADQLPVDFILQEYKARRDAGEQIEHEEFVARFPSQAERLRAELREIDTNIEPTARFVRCPQCHSSISAPELHALALEAPQAEKVAEIKNLSLDEVARHTRANTRRLFGLPDSAG